MFSSACMCFLCSSIVLQFGLQAVLVKLWCCYCNVLVLTRYYSPDGFSHFSRRRSPHHAAVIIKHEHSEKELSHHLTYLHHCSVCVVCWLYYMASMLTCEMPAERQLFLMSCVISEAILVRAGFEAHHPGSGGPCRQRQSCSCPVRHGIVSKREDAEVITAAVGCGRGVSVCWCCQACQPAAGMCCSQVWQKGEQVLVLPGLSAS